jgi:hypothetical protein
MDAESKKANGSGFRQLLLRKLASLYIKEKFGICVGHQTLARKAVEGGGPPFLRFGNRVYYDPDDLDRWVIEQLGKKLGSTSECA